MSDTANAMLCVAVITASIAVRVAVMRRMERRLAKFLRHPV